MTIIKELFFAFISTMGLSILFRSPKKAIVPAGLIGTAGWGLLSLGKFALASSIAASFLAALSVGLLGEFAARKIKKPATLFVTSGIVPLVPGAGMYYTMVALIEKDYTAAITKGVETFFIAAAISMGIIISSAFSYSIQRVKHID